MSARTLLTFEQFEQLHDDGLKHELLRGEHIVLPPPKTRHSVVRDNLSDFLRPYVKKHRLGRVHPEAGFKLPVDTWLQPDLSFVRSRQIQTSDPNAYYLGAPALAIEVASESNTVEQLDLKMEQYFAHGTEEVWVVYPRTKRIQIHFPDGQSKTARNELKSELFPGLAIPLSAVFAED